ncbi:MAG: BamA/TamA family outer membrane protein [Gemmatimonadota bacterium]
MDKAQRRLRASVGNAPGPRRLQAARVGPGVVALNGAALRRAAVVGLALCWNAAVPPGSLSAQGIRDLEVEQVRFEGNVTYPSSLLQAAVITEATTCRTFLFYFPLPLCPLTNWGLAKERSYLDESELELDVLRLSLFYRQRGFRDVAVDTVLERTQTSAKVLFRISENTPTLVAVVKVEGLGGSIDSAQVAADLPLAVGGRLDLIELARAEALITDRLQEAGYINAAVLREYFIPNDGGGAEVTLTAEPGSLARVGDVQIVGSGPIGDDVVRANLEFQPGDTFRPSRVIQSQTRLYGLEAFQAANISRVSPPESDTLVDLIVQVTPAPLRTIQAGVGLSTTECGQLESSFTHRNFFGGARVMTVTAKLSNIGARSLEGRFPCQDVSEAEVYQDLNYAVQADFAQPVFALGRNTFRAGLFFEKESVPDLFVRNSKGGELSLTRTLSAGMLLTLLYRAELTSFADQSADVFFCVSFGVCQPSDIGLLSESRWLSPLVLRWNYENTDNLLFPSSGLRLFAEAERAGALTGSDYRYFRLVTSGSVFRPLGRSVVLALHARWGAVFPTRSSIFSGAGGLVDEIVHPQKRFFGGGPNSVRGFGLNLLGPTVLVVDTEQDCAGLTPDACIGELEPGQFDERPVGGNSVVEGNIELRWQVSRKWSLVGFVDAGQVWEDLSNTSAPIATPGLGFRFRSPVGSLRLDLGYNLSGVSRKPVVAVLPGGEILDLNQQIDFDPFTFDNPDLATEVFRRLQLQVSIGEAF